RVTRRVALRNLVASPAIGGNAVVSRLYDQLVKYETVHDSLTTGDWARAVTNPDVQRLLPLIATTEANLVGAVQGVVASLDARIGVLNDLQARSLATARQLSTTQAADELLAEQVENARCIAAKTSRTSGSRFSASCPTRTATRRMVRRRSWKRCAASDSM